MGDTQKKRKQHWVPRFYLNAFAVPETKGSKEPQVYAFSKLEGDAAEVLKVATKNVATKAYLYSPIDEQGVRDYTFEDKQADLESTLSRLWQLLAEENVPLVEGYRKGLAMFIANTYLRHPRQRAVSRDIVERFHAVIAERFREGGDNLKEVKLTYGSRDVCVSRLEFEEYHPHTDNDYHQQFVGFVDENMIEVAEVLLRRRWNVIVSERGHFITSDNPVCLAGPADRQFGFGTPDTRVFLPLTPGKMLVIDDDTRGGDRYVPIRECPGDVVEPEAGFNWQVFCNAYRFIFGPRDLDEVLADGLKFADNLTSSDPNGPYYALLDRDGQRIRVSRNAQCWCGSGRKYKRCHLLLEREIDFNADSLRNVAYERRDLEVEDRR